MAVVDWSQDHIARRLLEGGINGDKTTGMDRPSLNHYWVGDMGVRRWGMAVGMGSTG
jgi:hypothetical protein